MAYGNTLGNHMLVIKNSEFEENKAKRVSSIAFIPFHDFLMILNENRMEVHYS